jgi:predicted CoA-substrate-specific enzyme activase
VKKTAGKRAAFTLGLDLGSRSVKAVLLDPRDLRIAALSVRDGTPDKAADADALLEDVLAGAGISRAEIGRAVATGYGRVQAGFADATSTEIACHAAGVRHFLPEARTVVDIGGQDSKVILLDEDGRVRDFAMNDRCAAGCGRFLEVVARILGTDVGGLPGLAREAGAESEISSMCVVFAESEVIGMLGRGFPPADVAAGIMRSIARRVAGLAKRVGIRPPVALTGGVALNEAMAASLSRELVESLVIPSDPRITGALGAALIAAREAAKTRRPKASRIARPAKSAGKPAAGTSPPAHRLRSVARFDDMTSNAVGYAQAEKALGRKIVSIFCEFTPRELILAAEAVPVCACGGSHETALAAERELPAALCPLIKSSYGYALEKASPFFEMSDLLVAETTCDGKKKMFELLGLRKPLHLLKLPQKPQDEGAFRRWREEIEGLKRRLEELTGRTISAESLRKAVRLMNRERRLRRDVARLAGRGLTGREVLSVKSVISGIPEDLEAYERILAEAAVLRPEPDGRPSVLMTGVPMPHGAEKVLDIIEAAGATVVAQESCTGLKPLDEDVAEDGDPLDAIARKYFHLPCSCMTPNAGRFALLDRLVKEFRPRGVVDLVWQSCLTYDVESELVRRHVESRHGLPYLKVVTDYSPSDAPRLRLRVEAFVGLLASR